MAWPLLTAARMQLAKWLETPYGEGELPPKVRNAEEACEVALAGKNHYEVIKAYRGASPVELKACYKRMALMLHPDKNPSEDAAIAFKKVGAPPAVPHLSPLTQCR